MCLYNNGQKEYGRVKLHINSEKKRETTGFTTFQQMCAKQLQNVILPFESDVRWTHKLNETSVI